MNLFNSPTGTNPGAQPFRHWLYPGFMQAVRGLALVISSLFASLSAAETPPGPPSVVVPDAVHEIAPSAVDRYLVDHTDTVIIDVRTENERRTRGHILNSLHHDYFHTERTHEALTKLDKSKPCIVYCAIGGRAKLVAVEMHTLGFKNILLLQGGFNAWLAAGQAVAK